MTRSGANWYAGAEVSQNDGGGCNDGLTADEAAGLSADVSVLSAEESLTKAWSGTPDCGGGCPVEGAELSQNGVCVVSALSGEGVRVACVSGVCAASVSPLSRSGNCAFEDAFSKAPAPDTACNGNGSAKDIRAVGARECTPREKQIAGQIRGDAFSTR